MLRIKLIRRRVPVFVAPVVFVNNARGQAIFIPLNSIVKKIKICLNFRLLKHKDIGERKLLFSSIFYLITLIYRIRKRLIDYIYWWSIIVFAVYGMQIAANDIEIRSRENN